MRDKEYFYREDWKTFKKKFLRLCEEVPAQIKNSNGKITLWEKEVNLTE